MPLILEEIKRLQASHNHVQHSDRLRCAICNCKDYRYLDHRFGLKDVFTPYALTLPVYKKKSAALATALQHSRILTSEMPVPKWIQQAKVTPQVNQSQVITSLEGSMLPSNSTSGASSFPSNSSLGASSLPLNSSLGASSEPSSLATLAALAASATMMPSNPQLEIPINLSNQKVTAHSDGSHDFIFRPDQNNLRCGPRQGIRPPTLDQGTSMVSNSFVDPADFPGRNLGVSPEVGSDYYDIQLESDNEQDEGYVAAVAASKATSSVPIKVETIPGTPVKALADSSESGLTSSRPSKKRRRVAPRVTSDIDDDDDDHLESVAHTSAFYAPIYTQKTARKLNFEIDVSGDKMDKEGELM